MVSIGDVTRYSPFVDNQLVRKFRNSGSKFLTTDGQMVVGIVICSSDCVSVIGVVVFLLHYKLFTDPRGPNRVILVVSS